jgi:hypothetical protein
MLPARRRRRAREAEPLEDRAGDRTGVDPVLTCLDSVLELRKPLLTSVFH